MARRDSEIVQSKKPNSEYSEGERHQALMALAYKSGNARAAIKLLTSQGVERRPAVGPCNGGATSFIGMRTYASVTNFLCIYVQHSDEIHQLITEENQAEGELLKLLMEKKDDLTGHELSTALRNVSTSKAINFDKARLADDRPTSIVQTPDIGDIIKSLLGEGVSKEFVSAIVGAEDWEAVIDVEAEEVTTEEATDGG